MTAQTSANSALFKGIALMLLAALGFSFMNVLIRWTSGELHPFQIAFFRNLFGLVFMLPWLIKFGYRSFKTDRIGLFVIRALLGLFSMFCYFWGITVLPLAKAVALSFTVPLFVTIGAAVFLKEDVNGRRWAAVLVGFIGTLIILRPSIDGDLFASLVVIASSVTMAASVLVIKSLSRTEDANVIVMYMVLLMTPLSLPVAMTVWQWPTMETWLLVALMGFLGSFAHLMFTSSLKISDVSIVMPFDFARLPFIIVMAWIVFDQAVDQWTIIGAGIVFASGVYIARREAQLNKRRAMQAKVSS
ncbi:DMT family transporter [Marinicella sp. S1101]|uniref:DMT family transporter n=1 Tax=Marinicella marina TaxID=2996016 RepID=UPI002260AEEB|nr:DMT family transporter [Marinicella marina]MCX7553055.1 DMT family transporter [Marinicella marina]MDJ1139585.1 DMT family transporter [Marinicella marina]